MFIATATTQGTKALQGFSAAKTKQHKQNPTGIQRKGA